MAAGPAPPPGSPYAPVPRTIEAAGGGRRTTLWVVIAAAALIVAAIVLVWLFAFGENGDDFVGNWAPANGEGGGLVISKADGDFQVEMYDADLALTGSYPATLDGDTLAFRFTDTQSQLGQVEAVLEYVEDGDRLVLQLTAMGQEGARIEFVRVDALEPAAGPTPAPTASPTPTVTPTTSPTATPTGSPSPSPTSTAGGQYDQQVVDGIVQIQVGVLNWSAENGGFPPPEEVSAEGSVGQYVNPWPTNPFTGQPMVSGTESGDYTYEQLEGGQAYRLVGHLAGGLTFTVP